MPGRQQIPSLQLASGTTDERDLSYNLTTIGSVFYNTDTNNVEVRHVDPSNNVGWRDLVMNNKEQIDISGNADISGNLVVIGDASFQNIVVSGTVDVDNLNCTNAVTTDDVYMSRMRRASGYNTYCEWANGHHFDCYRYGVGGHIFHINHFTQQTVYLKRSAYSDRRIKEDIKDIDDVSALNILRKIKPKTYKYKLQPNMGTVYGFIAQEVREILPYATNLTRLSAPFDREDFADANILEDGTVELASPCEQIEVGKNAQFYYETSTSTRDFIVLEILSPTRFKVEIDSEDKEWIGQTKLVGKEVDDFHGIDKDAIFTVATASLQEVDRQLQAEKSKTISLETQLEIYKNDISFIKRENIQLRTDISMIRTHIGI